MKKTAIFPGSFDPFTKGHEDIINRSIALFDKIIIAVGVNPSKKRFFEVDFMIEKIANVYKNEPNIEVSSYEGLTAEFARQNEAKYIIRGLRNATDLEYENAISLANKYLNNELETIFLLTQPNFSHISSTIVREIYRHRGDVTPFLPYLID